MEQKTKPQIVIGAASSNSGKTTLTMGLLRALRERGLYTQPFKCGPDYIDPKYHTLAAGHTSVNLDSWFSSPEHIRALYQHYGKEADVLVTEGVMGLFDGYRKMQGSSAEIAQILKGSGFTYCECTFYSVFSSPTHLRIQAFLPGNKCRRSYF